MPTKIIFIRHAEKAADPEPGSEGVREDGTLDKHSLTVRGWQRAGALVRYFAEPWATGIERPSAILAADRDGSPAVDEKRAKSRRPVQTVSPLHERLAGDAAWITSPVGDIDAAVQHIRACSGVVLVCWEHHRIPKMVAAFVDDPPEWPDRFDLVWIVDPVGNRHKLTQTAQALLAGDTVED